MAEEITLDTLMQGKENTALQKQEPVDVETVCTQIEELTPEQRERVEELKNSIESNFFCHILIIPSCTLYERALII